MSQSLIFPAIRTIITHFFTQKTVPTLLPPQFSTPTTTAKNLSFLFPLNKTHKPKTAVKPHAILNNTPISKPTLIFNNKDQRLVGQNGSLPIDNSGTTIAAVVTSVGGPPAAVGIVRLSGPSAVDIATRVFKPVRKKRKRKRNKKKSEGFCSWQPTSHVVDYGVVLDQEGNVIDEVLALPMLAPRSYTCEDVVELQCHGSEVCLTRVLRACLQAGARLAVPG